MKALIIKTSILIASIFGLNYVLFEKPFTDWINASLLLMLGLFGLAALVEVINDLLGLDDD